jgi:hypothetical protein
MPEIPNTVARFYHVMLRPKPGVSLDQVRAKMNLAIDWFYYGENCWILYTTSNAAKWYERLSNLVRPGGNVFICRLDVSDRNGWINKELWAWLKQPR